MYSQNLDNVGTVLRPGLPASYLTGLYETHLDVVDLRRSMEFYEGVLGLERGVVEPGRKLALYWVGGRGRSMLGLWEKPLADVRRQHFAFEVALADLDPVATALRSRGVALRDFFDKAAVAPTVFGWMPAASFYFDDPDGHQLEVLARLPGTPLPGVGVVPLEQWLAASRTPPDPLEHVPTGLPAIRAATAADWKDLWRLFQQVVAAGDAFAYDQETPEETARALWLEPPSNAFVAVDGERGGGRVLGSYYVRPNQPGRGAHVANAGYMVESAARGRGVAAALCEHSLDTARRLGFLSMQFNFVVSSNEAAVRAWKRHGFTVVGRIPAAFRHERLGLVDTLVMHREL